MSRERFMNLVNSVKSDIKELTIDELPSYLEQNPDVIVIDIREGQETLQGVIGDPMLIPRGVLEVKIESVFPDTKQKMVLYCGGGHRSALAAYNLQKMGYENVYSLAGGYRAWADKHG